ncbi:tetratricopeptide repeat protein [Streptoalloteichus tenebrarius]|uniref:tetratricopeptide repeat protein n=1 Tax=Streptoalloteichus tenebrarius (strain ATCC 17920 / DSM 40477 / JCM 4838 / CBS 697.72 / NBRC 16177 / NCIMB 11028 / NRRL B-12390 / A12253. 1 / ISP 5477) TaxID=1933 RepID=UPI0035EAADA1
MDTFVSSGDAPPPVTVPRELPPEPAPFVNRSKEMSLLADGLARREPHERPMVVVLSGPEGIGRTTLGVRWAHDVRDRFADGQLWVDLERVRQRGASGISDVAADFLRAMGVHDRWIPSDPSGRFGLLRSKTAEGRFLIGLDNVANSAEVMPLMPASSRSAVLITTHWELDELVTDGAEAVRLAPLADEDGLRLLAEHIGAERVEAEPEAAADLVRLCGGLPLALRVVAAQLRRRRRLSIADLARELGADPTLPRVDPSMLDRLRSEGRAVVNSACENSYRNLPDQARRLYRVLGLHPGPCFSREVVAAAADLPPHTADELLDVLHRGHLVEEDESSRRFRFHHQLIRLHAAGRAHAEESAEERDRIVDRMVRWYLRTAEAADWAVMGVRMRWPLGQQRPPEEPSFASSSAALSWLDDERITLLGAVRAAAERHWDDVVWRLCQALWALYLHRKYYHDWIESHRLAVEAARRCGNPWAEARMRSQLARAYREQKRWEEAHDELAEARRAAEDAGHPQLLASVVEFTGLTHFDQGDYPSALAAFRYSLRVNEELGDRRGIALQLQFVGRTLNRTGEHAEAAAAFERARDLLAELGDDRTKARVLTGLGDVYRHLGRLDDARAVLMEAVAIMRRLGAWDYESDALEPLVELTEGPSRVEHLRRLMEIHLSTGSPRAEEFRARLADAER